ncbi:MAG: hypothetical protein LBT16_03955 [Treponema sp.]|jgi:hypothetical protein|nr:hypothetical protein [Treponema sp.]
MAYIEVERAPIIHNLSRTQALTGIADGNMANFAQLPPVLAEKCAKSPIKTRLSDIQALAGLPSYARPDRVFVSGETLLNSGGIAGLAPELRMGEGVFFGYDTSSRIPLEGFEGNAFALSGIYDKEKTSANR